MTIPQILKNIAPYVRPYRWLVACTLVMTVITSMIAQVNAIVLQYTVDEVNKLVEAGKGLLEGMPIVVWISVILLAKELLSVVIKFGQQQRIAIARMFIKNPPIIFLDEPTASLDAIATEQIKNSIDAIKKDRTVIIISHSLSQIIDSEAIYSLEQGRVMEHGTHEECYAMKGVYRRIFDASARSLNIEKIAKTRLEVVG